MEAVPDLGVAHVRVARPTNDLLAVIRFYRDGLGFDVLYAFENHQGFDGVMLGRKGCAYHLEFTFKQGHKVPRAPTDDNLLVFYIPETDNWEAAVTRMEQAGFSSVAAYNPYWDQRGRTFVDPDGYRVVLENSRWDS